MPGKKNNAHATSAPTPSESVSSAGTADRATASEPHEYPFPIVGIGASAGGLEALEGFFRQISPDSGMAYVIIQHLDPSHKSLMGELLQRLTSIPVCELEDGMAAEANHAYLNPPNKQVVIFNGRFQLLDPVKTHGLNLPIDAFFRSLAEDQGRNAIGIIVSGTGSDGSLGLKAIKGTGGMTIAQAENQARYAGMPHSAIQLGLADMILPVEQMPSELQSYVRHPYIERPALPESGDDSVEQALYKVFALLRAKTGHDFSGYKDSTIRRRIERRVAVHRFANLAEYIRYLQETPEEAHTLFKDLLIGVTSFFRDPGIYDVLKAQVLPDLMTHKAGNDPVRVWVPGCATGEEAYSLAMLLQEVAEELNDPRDIQIFASDLDRDSIDYARGAVYPGSIAADVPAERLQRFFTKEDDSYKVIKRLREMVVFAEHNLIKDPPFSKLDLVSCRNLLIYLKPDLQKRIFPLFHYTLEPGGVLVLGTSESVGEFTDLFDTLDRKSKIFRCRAPFSEQMPNYALAPFFDSRSAPQFPPDRQGTHKRELRSSIERIVIDDYAPPCAAIDSQGRILYFIGNTDPYLRPPSGDPVFDVVSMARYGLKHKLQSAIRTVVKQKKTVRCDKLRVKRNDSFGTVDVVVRPLLNPRFASGTLLVIFHERPTAETEIRPQKPDEMVPHDAYTDSLELELQTTKESLQTTVEELETSNEELRSTNEELQSVNEELQSSNEELKTSKEELQSTNEELTTVNAELQLKVDELSQVNNDINNLLASTEIGTIFLDIHLRIKRFTPAMKKIFNLIRSDVDRPIGDITSNLHYDALYDDAKAVLDTLDRKELEIPSSEGRWYSIRIAPYRTTDNIIDGVVVTFVDITAVKSAQIAQQNAMRYAQSIVDTVRQPLMVLDADLRVQSANAAFYATFSLTPAITEQQRIYDVGDGQWNIPQLRELLERIIPDNDSFEDYAIERDDPAQGPRAMRLNARRIRQSGRPDLILLAIENVTGP